MVQPERPRTEYVNVSFCWFAFWWIVIFGVHVVTCAYNVIYAKFYWGFDTTLLSYILEYNEIGMPRKYFRTISSVFMILTAVHGIFALAMIVASFRQRTLAFSRWKAHGESDETKFGTRKRGNSACHENILSTTCPGRGVDFVAMVYHKVTGRHGILGVNGRYFHFILICRELLETTLQSVQAIKMSKFLAHMLLNRFFACLLAINCWSSVLTYSRWFWQREAERRFAAIVCDCVLNLMTTIGVSTILALSYVKQFNVDGTGFDFDLLVDDNWSAELFNEVQMIIVVSWWDLMSRAIFAFSLAASTADMKTLVHHDRSDQVAGVHSPTIHLIRNAASVAPSLITGNEGPISAEGRKTHIVRQSSYEATGLVTHLGRTTLRVVHILFAGWGIVVVALHVHAARRGPLVQCTPKVHPMAGTLPSCFVVNFNCHSLGISGHKDEVQTELDKFDRHTATKVRFLHCPELEIPSSFQGFRLLQGIEVYNSTIVDWDSDAAITNTHHPKVTTLSIVRVNMSNGLLPDGFQSLDFPFKLEQLVFCETNLRTLPSDLDSKWPVGSGVYMENNQLIAVPQALTSLSPSYLFLSGNPMTELPPELFEESIPSITLGHLRLNQLPQNVTSTLTELYSLDVTNTNISFFWSWIDPFISRSPGIILSAGGTRYCLELEQITSGSASSFSVAFEAGHSSVLMNASTENWDVIRQAVDCSPSDWETQFDIKAWDQKFSLDPKNKET